MNLETSICVNKLNCQIKGKNHYHQIQKNVSKMQDNYRINRSIDRISSVMGDLVPKSCHSATNNDVRLLQLTIEYLKQTTHFRRGVNLCAEETKTFIKNSHLDADIMNKLMKKINRRICNIPEPNHLKVMTTVSEEHWLNITGKEMSDSFIHDTWRSDQSTVATGVLLDLSMKQNRFRDDVSDNSTTRKFCNNPKKREILEKIRKKILDKHRVSNIVQRVNIVEDVDLMWRPWRF